MFNMPPKHPRPCEQEQEQARDAPPQPKRQRLHAPTPSQAPASPTPTPTPTPTVAARADVADLLSPLSDEILVRILSYLSLPQLLSLAPVTRRFHRLAQDSQLWKALYYARFVLPRAMRIPGFREGNVDAARMRDRKLHYRGRHALWADGRLGGLVREPESHVGRVPTASRIELFSGDDDDAESAGTRGRVNWKRQYKIRHNWARGKCAVEELKLGAEPQDEAEEAETGVDGAELGDVDRTKMLVKVVEGLAVTADRSNGLRVWHLKTREVLAQIDLHDATQGGDEPSPPSCLAIDDRELEHGALDISVGFVDGSFGVWRLQLRDKSITQRYRHEKSSNGELLGLSYSHPYLLTATGAVLISLYTFDVPEKLGDDPGEEQDSVDSPSTLKTNNFNKEADTTTAQDGILLPPPYLITSLKSHTSDPPLALSIRRMASSTVASIAYTFFTRLGWAIGIQDLQITPNNNPKYAPNITTRLAYTTPFEPSRILSQLQSLSRTQARPRTGVQPQGSSPSAATSTSPSTPASIPRPRDESGPTTLCYTHPYLLATLPDNTLILHLCTSTASTLSISPGIRLWGHTSGISDAEITARGKAVSVSSRGEEMRVWELEGKPSGVRSRSVEIRAGSGGLGRSRGGGGGGAAAAKKGVGGADWEERRNWVGFDDEMVIVLKEARGGRESLLVYDFS